MNRKYDNRQEVLWRSKIGDKIILQEYEWEGKPAYAFINERLGADIGSCPAVHVNKMSQLASQYKAQGTILTMQNVELKKESYRKAEVQILFYESCQILTQTEQ